jgi:hypothetical protein
MNPPRPRALSATVISGWPKLAWVGVLDKGSGSVEAVHGPCVETAPEWIFEGAWPGRFAEGDFDRADLVVGSGVRLRDGSVVFVSPGDTLGRLYRLEDRDTAFVSNSLPALLAVADAGLAAGFDYAAAMASVARGLSRCVKEIPSSRGPIHIVHHDNLVARGGVVSLSPKPPDAPDFPDFGSYRDYLFSAAERLGRNASAPGRRHPVTPAVALSSGYDSAAAAVLARIAGARLAFTIEEGQKHATDLFRYEDSGYPIARQLGLDCGRYPRLRTSYRFEDAVWASLGHVGDVNLTGFDYPEPLCLLFTGFLGDAVWKKDPPARRDLLVRRDTSGARFSEARLELGVFNCAPAFWGFRRKKGILRLAHLPEMKPWTVGGGYDRPVPRRLAEEAGIARGTFALKKRASTFFRRYGRPLSPDLRDDFAGFLARRGRKPGTRAAEVATWILDGFEDLLLRRWRPAGLPAPLRNPFGLPDRTLFFLWANERLKRRYAEGLKAAGRRA